MLIIRELQNDARASNVAVAAKVGLSEGAVRRRIERLVADGHLHFAALADAEYMGYRLHVMFQIQTDPSAAETLIDAMVGLDQLSYVYHCMGQFNVCAVGYFESLDDARAFTTEELGQLDGLVEVRTVMIMRVAKRSHARATLGAPTSP